MLIKKVRYMHHRVHHTARFKMREMGLEQPTFECGRFFT